VGNGHAAAGFSACAPEFSAVDGDGAAGVLLAIVSVRLAVLAALLAFFFFPAFFFFLAAAFFLPAVLNDFFFGDAFLFFFFLPPFFAFFFAILILLQVVEQKEPGLKAPDYPTAGEGSPAPAS
jgi:hypothetical protein